MVDSSTFVPFNQDLPQDGVTSDDIVRQTEHRAVPQSIPAGTPQVSYEAEDYQAAPTLDTYQPPISAPQSTPLAAPAREPEWSAPSLPTAPTQFATTQIPVPPADTQIPAQPPQRTSISDSKIPNSNSTQPRFPGIEKPPAEEVVLEWESLSRPFKKRSRQYFSTGLIIMILVSMILFFIQQFLPIAVVLAFGFLTYVLSVVPPGIIKHKITTYGLRIEDTLYYWNELGRFWFSEKYGKKILHVEVARIPWRLTLLLGEVGEEEMTEILSEVLLKQKPPLTTMEKASEWIQAKIPLDNDPE